MFTSGYVIIPNYADTDHHKGAFGHQGWAADVVRYNSEFSGRWEDTSAIDIIHFLSANAADFLAGSTVRVYGLPVLGGGSGLIKGDFFSGDLYLSGELFENQSATGRTPVFAVGGSGSSIAPAWMRQLSGPLTPGGGDADDVYWNGADLAGNFTEQTVSGTATWTEQDNLLSALINNQTVNDVTAQLQPVTFTIGDEWVVPILGHLSPDPITGHHAAGIIFTDGTATTSNAVWGHAQFVHGDPTQVGVTFVGRTGTLTDLSTAPWISDAATNDGNFLYLKLKYSAANTFIFSLSPNGVMFSVFGEADISKTMTPTHVGVAAWIASANDAIVTFGPLRKTA